MMIAKAEAAASRTPQAAHQNKQPLHKSLRGCTMLTMNVAMKLMNRLLQLPYH